MVEWMNYDASFMVYVLQKYAHDFQVYQKIVIRHYDYFFMDIIF